MVVGARGQWLHCISSQEERRLLQALMASSFPVVSFTEGLRTLANGGTKVIPHGQGQRHRRRFIF